MNIQQRYTTVHIFYGMLYAASFGFASFYLQGFGVKAGTVGVIMAFAGIVSAVLQAVLGRMTDKRIITWKTILICIAFLFLCFNSVMLLAGNKVIKCFAMGGFLMCITYFNPFVNGASFSYQRAGEKVNYGLSRGMNSLSYAISSFVLGIMAREAGLNLVPAAGLAGSFLLMAGVMFLPYFYEDMETNVEKKGQFSIRKYPKFFLVAAGLTLSLSFHSMISSYLINIIISAGGDSSNLGIAIAVSGILEPPVMILFSRIIGRISVQKLFIIAAFFYVVKGVILMQAEDVLIVYLAQSLQMLTYAVIIPASVHYAEESMDMEDKLQGQAVMSCCITLGSVVGSMVGGFLIQFTGLGNALFSGTIMAFAGMVLIAIGVGKKKGN